MLIASWNVNSVNSRLERLVEWLGKNEPDVLCLQELKCTDEKFPYDDIEKCGYHCSVHGQKTYNGVTIISKKPAKKVVKGFGDIYADQHSRLISAKVGGVDIINGYFPNGRAVGSEAWEYKLEWMGKLLEFLGQNYDPKGKVVLCGDFNVAPDDLDVANPDDWADTVLTHGDVRAAYAKIKAWGFEDVVRKHNPAGGVYSWWDYRRLGFPRNDGLRIDHILMTGVLAGRCDKGYVDRDERKKRGELKPSDHAPVISVVSKQ